MNANDELRAMLDERGANWDYGITGAATTKFSANGVDLTFMPMRDGLICTTILTPAQAIAATLGQTVTGETSDGYHTFNELYHHRAVLFSVVVRDHPGLAWKSKLHHDGTMYDGMFIVGINTPKGQATYHYDVDPYWEMFDCKELLRAPEWDGHTPDQAIERIATLGPRTCRLVETEHEQEIDDEFGKGTFSYWSWDCDECGHENTEYGRFCAGCGAKVVGE